MPHYTTNYNDPSLTQDNIASRKIFKDLNRATTGQGKYPTDQIDGTGVLATRTQMKQDLDTCLSNLAGCITAYQTQIAALNSGQVKYYTVRNELAITHVMHQALALNDDMLDLTADANKIVAVGVPTQGRYPSGYNRGW